MFTPEQRDRTRAQLLAHAKSDDSITGFAHTGSHATNTGDRWSDTDIVLAVRGEVADTANRWTTWIYDEFDARHHWDLNVGATTVIRVFLLPDWVELDLTFAPESEFGARGPAWQTLFGTPHEQPPFPPPDRDTVIGFAWHHALHARICLERGRSWQAAHWINALRDQLITLACLRLDLPTAYSKGAHLLPDEVTTPLESTLIRSLTAPELRRALTATITAATTELNLSDPQLAARLHPMLTELT
ncbi:hypothetical protein OG824_15410 [Streptomyces prunicolor]|uniref:hypothetical protein n=1 Tax=Streptomyces prunicolor TaxID=67348 RepID=UPI00224CF4A4|nr:hypothetical protein [Streptomyces prunicolor]MCX5236586.1 hypothetical protein [Streptomyces prunicolor]